MAQKVIYLYVPVKPVFLFRGTKQIAIHFCYNDHIYMHFSLLNYSEIKMVPQYCFYSSAGVPAIPATIFMSVLNLRLVNTIGLILKNFPTILIFSYLLATP